MNDNKNILDAPLTTPRQAQHNGPDYTAASSLDYAVNVFLLLIVGLFATGALFERGAFMYLLLWNLVLGAYQLLSALVGAVRGNRKKLYYLVAAIAYLFFLYSMATVFSSGISGTNELVFWSVFVVALPLAGAVYYTILCREAKNRNV